MAKTADEYDKGRKNSSLRCKNKADEESTIQYPTRNPLICRPFIMIYDKQWQKKNYKRQSLFGTNFS